MSHHVLFRTSPEMHGEYEVASSVWGEGLVRYRTLVPRDSLVVARYSCVPFYEELAEELALRGSRLVNSVSEHRFIVEMQWYHTLRDAGVDTPQSWFDRGWATVPDAEHGWVVKGKKTSRKWKWATHMRAESREDLASVQRRLYDDALVSEQGLVVREYVPLEILEEGINGVPFANEWRCFFLGARMLAAGFYWDVAEDAGQMGPLPDGARALAQRAADVLGEHVPAFVVDVARTRRGAWTVIEVNDLQMSGLSTIEPRPFYEELRAALQDARL